MDFVFNGIPVEVKYKEKIEREDLKNLLEFMKIFKVSKGYIISKDEFNEINIEDKKMKIIPVWYFALQGLE